MPDGRQNAALAGVYADFRLVKTRSVMQAVIELPIEQSERFVEMFGLPRPGGEIHVAVARLQVPAESEPPRETRVEKAPADARIDTTNRSKVGRQVYAAKTPGEKLSAKAGMLCGDQQFWLWFGRRLGFETLPIVDKGICADFLRRHLNIASRAELATDERARNQFLDLLWQYEHREDPNA